MLIIKRHCLRVVKKPQRLRYGFSPWIGELTVRLNVNSMATSIRRFRPLFKGTGFNVACQTIDVKKPHCYTEERFPMYKFRKICFAPLTV